uniref:Uncharacterized protein n=1 Tax=Arundo donax TaxID=35708 RepID=A0A0A9BKH5_ARUDO
MMNGLSQVLAFCSAGFPIFLLSQYTIRGIFIRFTIAEQNNDQRMRQSQNKLIPSIKWLIDPFPLKELGFMLNLNLLSAQPVLCHRNSTSYIQEGIP